MGIEEVPQRVLDRFWSSCVSVGSPNECWPWTKSTRKGYGAIGWSEGGQPRRVAAHRLAYMSRVGPIPDGLVIDHLCRNRSCCNPAHMEPVTSVENVMRGESLAAQNARKTHCPNGHEYTPENTATWGGVRKCRACARSWRRRAREAAGIPEQPKAPPAWTLAPDVAAEIERQMALLPECCPEGHSMSGDNVLPYKKWSHVNFVLLCRECKNRKQREYRARRKARLSARADTEEASGTEWYCEAGAVGIQTTACTPERRIHSHPCGWVLTEEAP